MVDYGYDEEMRDMRELLVRLQAFLEDEDSLKTYPRQGGSGYLFVDELNRIIDARVDRKVREILGDDGK